MPFVSQLIVLYDANVLYPSLLRSLLLWQATAGLFKAKWTEEINDEWSRNLMEQRPDITPDQIARICQLMNSNVLDALVEGYQDRIPTIIGLPDPNDRHVLAATIVGQADVIVTYNVKDFPLEALLPYGIEVQHPDEFLYHLLDMKSRSCM